MTHPTPLTLSATAGALLLAVPVAVQLALWPDLDDMPAGHLVFGVSQLLAWGLLMSLCLRIPTLHPDATATRGGRVGRRAALVGCALQMAFAAVYLGSTLMTGEPLETAFWFFLLGFVALLVGGITWGLTLRRQRELHTAGTGFMLVGSLGFLAVVAGDNIVHEITLLGSYASWIVVGIGADRAAAVPSDPRTAGSSSAT
ncbi:hypothetical protein BH24ACT8_BH24ACT8_05210 [soil metagenome]